MGRTSWFWRALLALRASVLALCGVIALTGPARSDQPSPWPDVLTLEEAAAYLRLSPGELSQLADWRQVPGRRIGAHWRFSRAALLEWLEGEWGPYITPYEPVAPAAGGYQTAVIPAWESYAVSTTTQPPGAQILPPATMAQVTGAGTTLAQNEVPPEPAEPTAGAPEEPIGEAPEERTADEIFLRGQRVLLAPGEVTLDLALFYSESDDSLLVLVGGVCCLLGTVEQETFTTALIGRYGLFEETELFASTSYRNQDTGFFLGNTKVSDVSLNEFGDVRLGVRRTVLHERVGLPDVIVTVDGRIPTGDTSYAVGGGLALIKSIDPAVLFASANYRHSFSRDFADVTRLEAEDRIDATVGYALALNDTLTISTAVSGLFTSATDFDNARLRQRETFSLQFGLTSYLAEGLYIEPTVSFGLNDPGNSFAIGVSLPYTF